MIRANGLAAATGLSAGGVESGGFWEGKTRTALQACSTPLRSTAARHASCSVDPRPSAAVRRRRDPQPATRTPRRAGTTRWRDDRRRPQDPRLDLDGVSLALSASPTRACSMRSAPGPASTSTPSTSSPTTAPSTCSPPAPEQARLGRWSRRSSKTSSRRPGTSPPRSPGARLDPPLLLALDEIGNLAPLPSLPVLMAEGGGTGITTLPVFSRSPRRATSGATTRPARSGTPASSRSSSAAHPTAGPPGPLHPHRRARREHRHRDRLGDNARRRVPLRNQRSTRRVPVTDLPPLDRIRTHRNAVRRPAGGLAHGPSRPRGQLKTVVSAEQTSFR
jgi:type IV secretion system protein VirD4